MTQEEPKTMTAKDAWIAMANGECVKSFRKVFRIYDGCLLVWSLTLETWAATSTIDVGPYSIVPDPSKPVEDEYKSELNELIKVIPYVRDDGDKVGRVLQFVRKYYVRKDK